MILKNIFFCRKSVESLSPKEAKPTTETGQATTAPSTARSSIYNETISSKSKTTTLTTGSRLRRPLSVDITKLTNTTRPLSAVVSQPPGPSRPASADVAKLISNSRPSTPKQSISPTQSQSELTKNPTPGSQKPAALTQGTDVKRKPPRPLPPVSQSKAKPAKEISKESRVQSKRDPKANETVRPIPAVKDQKTSKFSLLPFRKTSVDEKGNSNAIKARFQKFRSVSEVTKTSGFTESKSVPNLGILKNINNNDILYEEDDGGFVAARKKGATEALKSNLTTATSLRNVRR